MRKNTHMQKILPLLLKIAQTANTDTGENIRTELIAQITPSDIESLSANKHAFSYEEVFTTIKRKSILFAFHPDSNHKNFEALWTNLFKWVASIVPMAPANQDSPSTPTNAFLDPVTLFCEKYIVGSVPQVNYLCADNKVRHSFEEYNKKLDGLTKWMKSDTNNPDDAKAVFDADHAYLVSMQHYLKDPKALLVRFSIPDSFGYDEDNQACVKINAHINPSNQNHGEKPNESYLRVFFESYALTLSRLRLPNGSTSSCSSSRPFSSAGKYFLLATQQQISYALIKAKECGYPIFMLDILFDQIGISGSKNLDDILFFISLHRDFFITCLEKIPEFFSRILIKKVQSKSPVAFALDLEKYLAGLSHLLSTPEKPFKKYCSWDIFLKLANIHAGDSIRLTNINPDHVTNIFDNVCRLYFSEVIHEKTQSDPSVVLSVHAEWRHSDLKTRNEKRNQYREETKQSLTRIMKKKLKKQHLSPENMEHLDEQLDEKIAEGKAGKIEIEFITPYLDIKKCPLLFPQIPTLFSALVRNNPNLLTSYLDLQIEGQSDAASSALTIRAANVTDAQKKARYLSFDRIGLITLFTEDQRHISKWLEAANTEGPAFIVGRIGFDHPFRSHIVIHLINAAISEFKRTCAFSDTVRSFLFPSPDDNFIRTMQQICKKNITVSDNVVIKEIKEQLTNERLKNLSVMLLESLVLHRILIAPATYDPTYEINPSWSKVIDLSLSAEEKSKKLSSLSWIDV